MAKDIHLLGARTIPVQVTNERVDLGTVSIVPPPRTKAFVTFDATQHLNTGVNVLLGLECSFDAGATWQFLAATGRGGGVVYDDDGVVDAEMHLEVNLPPEVNNTRRQVKSWIIASRGSLMSAGGRMEVRD
jgi:hypothetical protein